MIDVLLRILPFFAVVGCGYLAAATRMFGAEASDWLARFVFYFALSAMLFRFAATLPIAETFDSEFAFAYLAGCSTLYLLITAVARLRGESPPVAAIEAQCAVIGNTGFLGLPMLVALIGPAAAGPVILTLAIDLVIFGTLVVVVITVSREGRVDAAAGLRILANVARNPMVMSMAAGLAWSAFDLPLAGPFDDFLLLLGGAATPTALFAIGASLAFHSAGRIAVSLWLAGAKLILHPLLVAVFALLVFDVDPFAAAVMIVAASMPAAGNVYLLANHFQVAPARVSATILLSTCASILTLSLAISLVPGLSMT
ncbi:MAG: AEC family transporter [Paracoccaceae bacterium]|nr:AEC family transporter [Paracoccaceae bacterium]